MDLIRRRSMLMQRANPAPANLIDFTTIVNNTVWWNGSRLTNYVGWCTPDKIAVVPGESYVLDRDSRRDGGVGQGYVSMFDSSGTYLRKMSVPDYATTMIIDNDVYFVGITLSMIHLDTSFFGLANS